MDASNVVYEVVNTQALASALHTEREATVEIESELAWAQLALEQTPEWQEVQRLKARLSEQRTLVALREGALREAALTAYRLTGDKNPAPGVSIKLFTKLDYIASAALQWCKVHASALVKEVLDTKSFEKIAESLPGAPVEVSEEPRVYVAADLSKVLN